MAVIISDACIKCEACIPSCPFDALDFNEQGKLTVNENKCKDCSKCVKVCPVSALSLPKKESAAKNLGADKVKQSAKAEESKAEQPEKTPGKTAKCGDVLVFAEQQEGKVAGVTFELIGAARKLADKLGVKVCAALLGDGVESAVPLLYSYGADMVYLFDNPVYHFYRTETYAAACSHLAQKYKPDIFLVGATTSGRDLAGAVATSLRTGLTADCTGLDIDTDRGLLLASRPAFGGNIMATIVCENHRPQMATVRPRVMQMPEAEKGRTGILVRETVQINVKNLRTAVLKIVKEQADGIKLEDARIIVAGGRGIQNEQGVALMKELAGVLGGVLAGSRGAVEKGLIDYSRQVGQTGQTVSPKLYIAVGISGAIQHIVGMQGAENIVAINTDPDCPMMKLATFGIEGDAFEILPLLIKEFKAAGLELREEAV